MSKRKRDYNDPDTRDWAMQPSGNQAVSLRANIAQSVSRLVSALKLARGFERQKMGRRQKEASDKPATLLRRREEVIVLRQLDLEKTASDHLIKRLSKAKKIRESSAFQSLYGSEPQLQPVRSDAEANVVARLLNSAPAKQAMTQNMEAIYKFLGLEPGPPLKASLPDKADGKSNRVAVHLKSEDSVTGSAEPQSTNEDGKISELGSDEIDTLAAAHSHRLADSESEDDNQFSPDSLGVPPPPSTRQHRIKADTGVTAFLPMLSMGGYYSGSEPDDEDTQIPEARKNRRGQRARQQLAKLKHGKNARHLQKANGKETRDFGWDPKRGAVDRSQRRIGGQASKQARRERGSRDPKSSRPGFGSTQVTQKQTSRDDAGPLHPSWEAAKQRKLQAEAQAQFAGKKIRFD